MWKYSKIPFNVIKIILYVTFNNVSAMLKYSSNIHRLLLCLFRDGPEWARQRGKIQKLMMHPTAATRYLHWQNPVARDFADYLGAKRGSDNVVENLYEDLFKYTMECKLTVVIHILGLAG